MSAGEIVHRAGELAKKEISARRRFDWSDFDCGDGPVPALPLPEHFATCPESLVAQWHEVADLALASRLPLLGRTFPARRSPRDWHRDPVTGGLWPSDVYCFKVPFRHMGAMGDPKYVWERGRLQYLQPIAALARKTGDDTLVRFCLDEIESWMEGNGPFNGLGWATGIEVALRIVSLVTVAGFLGELNIPRQTRRRLRACLNAHGCWLARYPSRFSSANNHLIAEAGGLFLLGMLAPDFKFAGRWARDGRRILAAQAAKQILADGVGAEQSPTYAAFTLEWYLLCDWLAARSGEPLPSAVRERLALAAEHFRWLLDDGGSHPGIGDDDEGRVFYSGPAEDRHVASIAGSISAYLRRPGIAPAHREGHLRNLWFGFPGEGKAPRGVKSFDSGGYTLLREEAGGRDVLLALDHGPLGYLSIAAHGHADALSVWLHLNGQPVLVDAGTYLYHSGGEWRDHFRSTRAHNTLMINGASSSRMAGAFNWSRKAKAWRETNSAALIEAVHDGYRKDFGVLHRRSLTKAGEGVFLLRDSLEGASAKPLDVEIGFLVHPDLEVMTVENGAQVRKGGELLLEMTAGAGLVPSVQKGEAFPPAGWYSPAFGEKVPAPRIVFARRCQAPADFEITLRIG
ncbi:MAG: heparinase II/III family protein [Hyphomicrobiales bacterium]